VLVDPQNAQENEAAEAFSHRLVQRALRHGGTSTGEHGVGLHKMQYLVEEHGVHTVGLMRAIKEALDPHDIFNPGKIIGPAEAVHTHQETQE
jgi:D-lactate dehydrogenase (cytochrome)